MNPDTDSKKNWRLLPNNRWTAVIDIILLIGVGCYLYQLL